jgi:hypothetical protein
MDWFWIALAVYVCTHEFLVGYICLFGHKYNWISLKVCVFLSNINLWLPMWLNWFERGVKTMILVDSEFNTL